MRSKCLTVAFALAFVFAAGMADAGPIGLGTWYEFAFGGPGSAATGCSPADPAGPGCSPSSGTPTVFADAPPWTFMAPASGATLTVTDAFLIGDQFSVFDFGGIVGSTSVVPAAGSCGDDPAGCLGVASSGVFALAPGAHSLTITATVSPFGSGAAYFRVDPAATPEPGILLLLGAGFAGLGFIRRLR
jgi:hypothetical protein